MARGSARTPGARQSWTRLWVLVGLLLVLYSTMAGTGTWKPKLGLDLQGGTSVILTPRATQKGQKVSSDAVNKAVDIIRQRVNGLGVSEAEVKRAGSQIEISVPGKGRADVVNLVGQTAELRFREVYLTGAAAPAATPKPSASKTPAAGASKTPSATTTPAASKTPSATTTPAAQTTPAAKASPAAAKTPSAAAAPGGASTPPTAVQNYYNSLTCGKTDVRQVKASTDKPTDWLAACDRDGTGKYLLKPATVIGTDVKTASATLQSTSAGTMQVNTGQWVVNVDFTGKGQSKFTKLTEQTTGKQVAIVLDGVVQSAPRIEQRIAGSAEISGSFNQKSAQDLASVLKYGALPLAFEKSQAESISPSLGSQSLHGGLIAGALGLALVVIYFFVYYRALGIVTIGSLLVSGLLVYASVVLLGEVVGFTLSLAGIAGLIVSVGVTADSFIVFYERLKDEVREGRSVRTSVERAWVRARRTILSADTVSFLAAAVLYLLSIGSVRGFAFTLGLSTILDVVVVFLFTKPVVTLLVRKPFFSTSRFSGLTVRAIGGSAPAQASGPPARQRLSKRTPSPAGGTAGRGGRGA